MEENLKTISFLLFFSIFIALVILGKQIDNEKLHENRVVTVGHIKTFGKQGSAKFSKYGTFKFVVNNVERTGRFDYNDFCKKLSFKEKNEIRNVMIPVVYERHSPSNHRLLLKRADYQEFELQISPWMDTLIQQYIDCK